MTKKHTVELIALLRAADELVPVTSHVKHKEKGGEYRVVDIVLREEDIKPLVVYAPVDYPTIKFSRPIDEFIERFAFIDKRGDGY